MMELYLKMYTYITETNNNSLINEPIIGNEFCHISDSRESEIESVDKAEDKNLEKLDNINNESELFENTTTKMIENYSEEILEVVADCLNDHIILL